MVTEDSEPPAPAFRVEKKRFQTTEERETSLAMIENIWNCQFGSYWIPTITLIIV